MGAQSLVIGKMFGEGFQYGKRKISAMPNEEFNKLTFEKMMSNAREELKASIPTMNAAMQDMQPMVEVVVREFFNYISLVTKVITGTGEGPNIYQKEGHDIGDWIAQQIGIPHTPHDGGPTIPVTPVIPPTGHTTSPTTKKPSPKPQKIVVLGKELQQFNLHKELTALINKFSKLLGPKGPSGTPSQTKSVWQSYLQSYMKSLVFVQNWIRQNSSMVKYVTWLRQ